MGTPGYRSRRTCGSAPTASPRTGISTAKRRRRARGEYTLVGNQMSSTRILGEVNIGEHRYKGKGGKDLVCKKCGDVIPRYIVVNGSVVSLHKRQYCLSCSPFGAGNNFVLHKMTTTEYKRCPFCNKEKKRTEFYVRSGRGRRGVSTYCKECSAKDASQRSRGMKIRMVKYKGGKCVICQYDRCLEAIDFHHLDPSQKGDIWQKIKKHKWEYVQKELDKCILVCARCHREIEAGMHSEIVEKMF